MKSDSFMEFVLEQYEIPVDIIEDRDALALWAVQAIRAQTVHKSRQEIQTVTAAAKFTTD